jgi:beta-glucosidase
MRSAFSSAAALAALTGVVSGQASSPPSYPSPWMQGGNEWQEAYEKAQHFVSQLTLLEKVNLTTGVGWEGESCVGNTGSIPRLNFRGTSLTIQTVRQKEFDSDIEYRTVSARLSTGSS